MATPKQQTVNYYESLKASGDYRKYSTTGWDGTARSAWTPASDKLVRIRRVHLSITVETAPAAIEGTIITLREEDSGKGMCALLAIPGGTVAGETFFISLDLGDGVVTETAGKHVRLDVQDTMTTGRFIVTLIVQGDEE